MGKTLYALITRQCNLSCPHCDVYKLEDDFNKEKFLEKLLSFDGRIILFGGEPTIYQDRMFDIINECEINNKKISSISTNLMILNDKLIEYYNKLGSVATSWNPNRFTKIQYDVWYNNCKQLSGITKVKPSLLITMDDDLLNFGVDNFLKIVDQWNASMFKRIKLEHYNGNMDSKYFERVDDFLCELYTKWRSDIPNEIADRINHWYFDCSGVYTLNPDGTLTHKCPHDVKPAMVMECYTCERASICKPCILQHHCSFPKKFAKLVNEMKGDK